LVSSFDNIKLHLPEGMAYTCHNSGVCCNVFDSIPVDEAAAQALAGMDSAALHSRAGNRPDNAISLREPAADRPVLARKACGSCVMLTEDHLCAIHSIAGEAAKPQACQDFPWRYVETPNGVYVGLSFVCPSVRANSGRPVAAQEAELTARYARAASVREAPDVVALNPRKMISWSDYLQIETALVELISNAAEPLPARLIAACLLPGFVDEMLARSASEPGVTLEIKEVLGALRARNFDVLWRLAHKKSRASDSPRPRRMFLGMLTSFANTLQRRQDQGRLATVTNVMLQYARSAAGLGKIRLAPVEQTISHDQLDQARLPHHGPLAEQIARYLRHCIERKDLVLFGDVNRRMRLLATSGALIAWYAAASQAEGQPPEKAWDEAIGTVERLYGFHSTFYHFFERNRTFSDVVDSFLLKPGFPYVLFG
jgi:Fe-S-cluster containining protein